MALCSNDDMQQPLERGGEADLYKIVLITGVSKGLGRALALELANHGHTIVGCSRDKKKLDLLRAELLDTSPRNHLLLNFDVSLDDNVEEMARTVMEKFGAPDIIVNNAAIINTNGEMWKIPKKEFDDVIDVNIKGTANVLRHFIPLLIPKNKGTIVNMTSICGRVGVALISPYYSSKWAVEGLSKSVAKELLDGMTIVALDPGIIYTEMLTSLLGDVAFQYQSPEQWASKAASMILNLTRKDNGASLTVQDPGALPS